MSTQLQEWGVDRMSLMERLQLFHELWETLAEEAEQTPFTSKQCEEIDQRLASHQLHPERAIPWQQIEDETLAKLRQ